MTNNIDYIDKSVKSAAERLMIVIELFFFYSVPTTASSTSSARVNPFAVRLTRSISIPTKIALESRGR